MPVGPAIRPRRTRDAAPIYRLGSRALRPLFRRTSRSLRGAGTWDGALARLAGVDPGRITGAVAPGIRESLRETERWHTGIFRRRMGRFADTTGLRRLGPFALERPVLRTVGYMERMPERFLANLTQRIGRLQARGVEFTPARLRAAIQLSQQVARNHVRLIAENESFTFVAELNARRQREVGVERYRWRTQGDDRVRETHAANDGSTFLWSSPPSTGHPGDEVRCRCSAIPVFPRRRQRR